MLTTKLDNLGLIKISGDDAEQFLQGQLTNDVTLLDNNWQYTGYCNPQGRLIALIILWRTGVDFYALIDDALQDLTVKRLSMFIMRSKVAIESLTEPAIVACLAGENLDAKDKNATLPLPTQELQSGLLITKNQWTYLSFGTRGLLVRQTQENQPIDSSAELQERWEKLDILAGLPKVSTETHEMFVPQMVNLDLLNGINFNKGCYTGQEIVARMHYLGKLKQRMFVCTANSGTAGDKVSTQTGEIAGNLVTNVVQGVCLAVVRLKHVQAALVLESGLSIAVESKQPYDLSPPTSGRTASLH